MNLSSVKFLVLAPAFASTHALAAEPPTRADSISEKRLELLFRPLLGERMALSTDGHYLAYTEHTGTDLNIIVYDLDRLKIKTRITADDDRPILFSQEKQRTQLRFLEWANDHRLVFAPKIERIIPVTKKPPLDFLDGAASPEHRAIMSEMLSRTPSPSSSFLAPVMAVDADGGHPLDLDKKILRELAEAGTMTEGPTKTAPRLHGFGTGPQRDRLLVEIPSTRPGTPTELFRINVTTGAYTSAHRESVRSGRLLYDQAGHARLNSFNNSLSLTTVFEYRAPDSKRWVPMPEPPAEDRGAQFIVSPETYFGPRVTALGFDFDPHILLYASNVGRDTFGIYGLDLRTRQRTDLALEVPHRDLIALDTSLATSPLVFDPFREKFVGVRTTFGPRPLSVWLDPELAAVQHAIEQRFPQRSAELLHWNVGRTRFIARTTGGTDPGSLFLVKKPAGSMTELTRAAPWLTGQDLHDTRFFEFSAPHGAQLTGHLTLPRTSRINPPPLIIWFADGLPPKPHPEFDPQAQVLADLGFVVCRLNQRGVLGLGARHRDALRGDFDRAPADDALAAIEWIAQHHRIDRKRVVTLGQGVAGYAALRATQLYPEAFRCAVVFDPVITFDHLVNPPPTGSDGGPIPSASAGPAPLITSVAPSFRREVNRTYLANSPVKLTDLSVTTHPEAWSVPVFIAERAQPQFPEVAAAVAEVRSQLRRRDLPSVTVEYLADFTSGQPAARARVYRALEEFFNLNLYHYHVKIGPTEVVK